MGRRRHQPATVKGGHGGRNLRPIRSETKGYYHALDSTSGYTLSVTKFKATIEYNNSATSATVQLENLWEEMRRFEYPHKYYVDLSQKLWDCQHKLLTDLSKVTGKSAD